MAPFGLQGVYTVEDIAPAGQYNVDHKIAEIKSGRDTRTLTMTQQWPVKVPIKCYDERLSPTEPLTTKMRIIDSFFPVAKGGTYCIPGPFGAGKTVLQQLISRHADGAWLSRRAANEPAKW